MHQDQFQWVYFEIQDRYNKMQDLQSTAATGVCVNRTIKGATFSNKH